MKVQPSIILLLSLLRVSLFASSGSAQTFQDGINVIAPTTSPGDFLPPRTPTLVRANPAVASNGRDFLVVWEEMESEPPFSQVGNPVTIRAARVRDTDGAVLDAAPITLPASWSSRSPAVASDGQDFLVVWQDFTKDRSPVGINCHFESDVVGARVRAADGAVLDTTPIVVSAHERGQGTPAVAPGQGEYLVVWKDSRASDCAETDIYGARVNARNGRVRDRDGFALSQMPGSEEAPAVGFNGRDYLIAWQIFEDTPNPGTHIFCTRLAGESMHVLDRPAIPLSHAPGWHFNAKVVWVDGLFLLAWESFRDDQAYAYAQGDVYLARLMNVGPRVFYDAGGIPALRGSISQLGPHLAVRNHEVLLTWQSGGIYGVRVPAMPRPDLDASRFEISPTADNPTGDPYKAHLGLAASTRNFLSVWVQNGNILAVRLDATTLQPLDPTALQVSR